MKKILFLLLAMLPMMAFAQSQQIDLMQAVPNDPTVRTGTLDCGIKYYIRHNAKDAQRANFHIMYNVGAVQEEDNQNGLAHFLEHMAFNGSKNFPGNGLIDYLQSIGVRFGENLNAGTSQEYTTYMVTNVPVTRQGIIDSVLLVLHDWAGFINLDHKDIDEERGVILEELRQGKNAGRRIWDKMSEYVFNNSIYAKRNVIGNAEHLKAFTYEDIESFYHKWYRPDMQAFVVVGDIDVDAVEARMKQIMADIKPYDVQTPKQKVIIADNEKPIIGIITDPEATSTDVTIIIRHRPVPTQHNNKVFKVKMDVIANLVNEMFNERLEDISSKENAPFLSANASYFPFVEPFDAFFIQGSSKDGESVKTLEAVYTEALRMQRGGFVTSEFERAKTQALSRNESQFKNAKDTRNRVYVEQYMENFRNNTPYPTAEYNYELVKNLIETTTLEEINAVAKAFVTEKNSAVIVSAPESSAIPTEAQITAALDKVNASEITLFVDDVKTEPLVDAAKIKAGKVVKQEKGHFQTDVWTLSNGVKVVLKHTDFKADEVIMSSTQKGGTSTIADLNDLASISYYPYFAQNAGLGNFSQSELTKALSGKIARVGAGFGKLSVVVNGSCAPKDIETMLQLTYLQYTAPRFEQADLNVVKNQWGAMLPNYEKTPDYIFQKTAVETSTANDPRAMLEIPSMELLDIVTLERMSKTYKAMLSNANGTTFVFTGNFDAATLKPLVEKYLGSLPATKVVPTWGKNEYKEVKGIVTNTFKTKMETPKVTNLVSYGGDMKWTLEERTNLAAISHILNIRYTKSIREEAGGTYGVSVQADTRQNPRPEFGFVIYFNTDAAKIDELLPIVHKEIDDMVAGSISEEHLKIYKEFAVKKFAENNISNNVWSNYISNQFVWGNDNYTDYVKSVENVTIESIKATAARLFGQKNIITVTQLPE